MRLWFAVTVLLVSFVCQTHGQLSHRDRLTRLHRATDEAELLELHERFDVPRGSLTNNGTGVGEEGFYWTAGFYGQEVDGYLRGDLNVDGIVDLEDIAILSYNFNSGRFLPNPVSDSSDTVDLSLDEDASVVLSSNGPVDIGGIELLSPGGGLVPLQQVAQTRPKRFGTNIIQQPLTFAQPSETGFEWILSNEPERIAWTTDPGWFVTLDGDLNTGIRSESSDLSLRWFERDSIDVHETSLADASVQTGDLIFDPVVFANFEVRPPSIFEGLFPEPALPPIDMVYETELDALLELHLRYRIPRGDIDGDGTVTKTDAETLKFTYGWEIVDSYALGDLNLDGQIDLEDLAIQYNNFGATDFQEDPPSLPAKAEFELDIDEQGRVTLTTLKPSEVSGMELLSPSGGLIRRNWPNFDLGDLDSHRFAQGESVGWTKTEGGSAVFDGEYFLVNSKTADLTLRWFEPDNSQVFSLALGEGPVTIEVPPVLGDINEDGIVEFGDFLILQSNFGNNNATPADGDIDGDGRVAFSDFLVLSENFGALVVASGAASVPEPSGLSLLSLGLAIVLWFRKRRQSTQPSSCFAEHQKDRGHGLRSPSVFGIGRWSLAGVFLICLLLLSEANEASAQIHPRQFILNSLNAAQNLDEVLDVHESEDFPRGNLTLSDWDRVSIYDFYRLSENYGKPATSYSDGDIDRDGQTDLTDLAIMTFNDRNSFYEPDPEPSDSIGNLGVSISENRSVVVSSSRPVQIGALEFRSPGGGLSLPEGALEQPRPVRFGDFFFPPPLLKQDVAALPGMKWVLSNEPDRIAFAPEFGWSVTLDGDLTTPVQSQFDDITLNWFETGDVQVHSRALNEGDARTGQSIVRPPTGLIDKEIQQPYLAVEAPDPFEVALGLVENTFALPDEFRFATNEETLLEAHRVFDIPRGDVNGDGSTNAIDGFAVSGNFGSETVGYAGGDLNVDGVVSLADYAIFQTHLGDTGFVEELPPGPPEANPGLWIDETGNILISSTNPVLLGGFEVFSPSGSIRLSSANGQGDRPGNFSKSLTRDIEGLVDRFTWAVGSDGGAIVVDALGGSAGDGEPGELSGTLVTNIAEADDLVLRWFEPGSTQVFTHRLGEGDPPNDDLQLFVRYPACSDPERDPIGTCTLVESSEQIDRLDEAEDLETLLELHEELDIARGDLAGNRVPRTPGDILRFRTNFGNEAEKYSDGDLNLDGIVDFYDVAIFGANAGAVGFDPSPEPVEAVAAFIYVDEEGKLVIGSDEVLPLGGIELTSASGGLVPPDLAGGFFGGVQPLPTVFRNNEQSVVCLTPTVRKLLSRTTSRPSN